MARFFRRRKFCRFTAEGTVEIDYKDLETLKAYVSETGMLTFPTMIIFNRLQTIQQLCCIKIRFKLHNRINIITLILRANGFTFIKRGCANHLCRLYLAKRMYSRGNVLPR